MKRSIAIATCAVATSLVASGTAFAQQLVYTPINPQFGGNPLNATQLEADASAQNKYSQVNSQSNQTQAQLFASQLQSELLSDLANQVSNAIFGPNATPSGTFAFGGETVSYTTALGQTTVTITSATGGKTVITVPNEATSTTTAAVN